MVIFFVSILTIDDGVFEVLARKGDILLGGLLVAITDLVYRFCIVNVWLIAMKYLPSLQVI